MSDGADNDERLSLRNWTVDQVDLLVAGIESGAGVDLIAQQTGKSQGAVRRATLKVKDATRAVLLVHMHNHAELWMPEDELELISHFNTGVDLSEVVRQSGRTANAVLGRLMLLGMVVLSGDSYCRLGQPGRPRKPLGYTWSDHLRLDMMAYGNPWTQEAVEHEAAPLPRVKCS